MVSGATLNDYFGEPFLPIILSTNDVTLGFEKYDISNSSLALLLRNIFIIHRLYSLQNCNIFSIFTNLCKVKATVTGCVYTDK